MDEECHHLNINDKGMCEECGTFLSCFEGSVSLEDNYSKNHISFTMDKFNLQENIKKLSISNNVKEFILSQVNKFDKHKREKSKKQQLFIYIINAYTILSRIGEKFEIPFNPYKILEELKLNIKDFNSVFSKNKNKFNSFCNCNISLNPLQFLKDICSKNNLEKEYNNIKRLYNILFKKDQDGMLQGNPNHTIISFVKMYCLSKNIKLNKFSITNNITETIIKKKICIFIDIIEEILEDIDINDINDIDTIKDLYINYKDK